MTYKEVVRMLNKQDGSTITKQAWEEIKKVVKEMREEGYPIHAEQLANAYGVVLTRDVEWNFEIAG